MDFGYSEKNLFLFFQVYKEKENLNFLAIF